MTLFELVCAHDRVAFIDESKVGATPSSGVSRMVAEADLVVARRIPSFTGPGVQEFPTQFEVIKCRTDGSLVGRTYTWNQIGDHEVIPLEYEVAAVERLEEISEDL